MMFPAVGSSIFFAIVWYKNGWQKDGRSETYRGEKTDRKRRGLTGSDYVKIHSHGWKMMDSDSFRFRTYTSIQCVFFHRGRREGEYLNVNLCIYLADLIVPFLEPGIRMSVNKMTRSFVYGNEIEQVVSICIWLGQMKRCTSEVWIWHVNIIHCFTVNY